MFVSMYNERREIESRTMQILFRARATSNARRGTSFIQPRCDGPKSTRIIPLQFNCCGIHGYGDYNGTAWWRDAQISGNRRQVPLTCCVLKNTEVRKSYFRGIITHPLCSGSYTLLDTSQNVTNIRMRTYANVLYIEIFRDSIYCSIFLHFSAPNKIANINRYKISKSHVSVYMKINDSYYLAGKKYGKSNERRVESVQQTCK